MRDGELPAPARGVDDTPGTGGTPGPGESRGGGGKQDAGLSNGGERSSAASPPRPGDAPHVLSASRYLAWLYSTAPQQPVLAKLCEIESEIAGSLRPGIDHHVAHARLQWWREECERCAQGRPVHPLTRELVKAYGAPPAGQPSPLAGISGFVDTAVWDLAGATFETRKELTAYCERWAAAMFGTASTQITNLADGASRWRTLGAAVREIELLADLAREAHAGRVRVPLDELERASVEVSSLAKPPWPASLVTLLSERHEALRATIGECLGAISRQEQANFRGLLVWAALVWRQSARAQRALPNIISPRRYHAFADGWQAWRAARRAAAGKLRLR
jgi:15-cis-phytoene synthase